MEQYYELYASCARVLKSFDPELRVGGPATANPAEALPFAEWCRAHEVPLDFLSYHSYPQNEACRFDSAEASPHEPGMHFVDVMRTTRTDLEAAGFGGLPRIMTEWNSQSQGKDWKAKWVGNETCNTLFSGAAVCHLAHACDADLDVMGWWVASDVFEEGGPQVEPYGSRYQYYGMLTIDGIPKAGFHAFRFLNRMRGRRYALPLPEGTPPTCGGIITDETSAVRALVWNCVFPYDTGDNWEVELDLPLPGFLRDRTEVRVVAAHVSEGQGSAYEAWRAMGAPANLTRMEQDMLTARSAPSYTGRMMPVENGHVRVSVTLKPNEFILLEAGGDPAGAAVDSSAEQDALDQQLMV
jgi:xylan 1,4-beta-xylosidase